MVTFHYVSVLKGSKQRGLPQACPLPEFHQQSCLPREWPGGENLQMDHPSQEYDLKTKAGTTYTWITSYTMQCKIIRMYDICPCVLSIFANMYIHGGGDEQN